MAGSLDKDSVDIRRPVSLKLADTKPPRDETNITAWEGCNCALEPVERPAGEESSITHGEKRGLGRIEGNK